MENATRPDIVEIENLESKYNLEDISFEDARWIFHDFIKDIIIGEKFLSSLKISENIIHQIIKYNEDIELFLNKKIDSETINAKGVESIVLMQKLQGKEKDAIEFVSSGLCDQEKSFFNEYGSSMHFQSLFFNAYQLEKIKLCKKFREYIENHSKIKSYKI